MAGPEQAPQTPERSEAPRDSAELYEKLEKKLENGAELGGEHSGENRVEKAAAEVREAISVEAGGAEKGAKKPKEGPSKTKRRGSISKKEREASFKKHMEHVQSELPPTERAFSKFIHNKAVEKTSEVVGGTIARPNAILAGAVVAFIAVLAVYLIAKNLGYVLSGFETIGAFIVGWILGVLFDFFRVMITGKKS